MSNKKEYAIGDTVQIGSVTLVCMESINGDCKLCDVHTMMESQFKCCTTFIGGCANFERTDNKDVIFKLKTE